MFALAWLLLPDQPAYRTGLIIVGLARCIAMVLIWSELACGDRDATAVLVAINSLFQIVADSLLGYFYITLLPKSSTVKALPGSKRGLPYRRPSGRKANRLLQRSLE